MKMTILKSVAAAAVAAGFAAGVSTTATASVESFYKNKTVTMYIGFSAGGGYDAHARLIMRHMVRHIPGNPKQVAKQYTGAGGVRVLNAI